MDREGNAEPIPVQPGVYWGASLSPDDRRVGLTTTNGDMETWILEIERGALTRFTFEGSNHFTVWTPDGENLVFSSNRDGAHNLFWKPADGSGTAERLSVSDGHQDPGSWSPDGRVLAYAQNHPQTGWDIWLLYMEDERREEPFLQTEFDEFRPMISPDGRWLAYVSRESGRLEVYVQPFPTGGRKWLISTGGGDEPLWAPNGRELFYRDGERLMVVAVDTHPVFGTERPRQLFETPPVVPMSYGSPDYDITSDGQRFLMLRPEPQSPPTQVYVVLNWFEELKRLVPTE
jgi:Tol biopolymer transport system component